MVNFGPSGSLIKKNYVWFKELRMIFFFIWLHCKWTSALHLAIQSWLECNQWVTKYVVQDILHVLMVYVLFLYASLSVYFPTFTLFTCCCSTVSLRFPIVHSWMRLNRVQELRCPVVPKLSPQLREQPRVHLQHSSTGGKRNQHISEQLSSGSRWCSQGKYWFRDSTSLQHTFFSC